MGEGEGVWAVLGGVVMLNLRSKCRGREVLGRENRKQDAKEHAQFIKIELAAFIIKQNKYSARRAAPKLLGIFSSVYLG